MLSIDDFALQEKTEQSITIVFVPTGQSFRFQAVNGRVTFGDPLVEGQKSKHPPWLIAWLARKVAQQGVPLEDHCGVGSVPFAPAQTPEHPSHVAGNRVASDEDNEVGGALAPADAPVVTEPAQEPAAPIQSSIQHDCLVCLEDGAKLQVLTSYLHRFGLTPETYRAKWGLPHDYPMVGLPLLPAGR